VLGPVFVFLYHREAELLKQDLGELFRRADVQGVASDFLDFLFKLREALAVAGAQFGEAIGVDAHADEFEVGENFDERNLNFFV